MTLVAFLATFSGAWVYLKLLLMTLLWCTPTTMMSSEKRGQFFHYLDLFGKWSLLDLLVLTQSMVGFYVRIKHPNLNILPPNFYHIDLIVTPAYGLYSFSFAITLSLILSHVQVIYHNKAVDYDNKNKNNAMQDNLNLLTNDEDRDKNIKGQHIIDDDERMLSVSAVSERYISNRSKVQTILITLLPLMALAVMIVGAIVPTWTFHVRGMIGLVAEFGEESSTVRTYSFYSAIVQLIEQSSITTPALSSFGVLLIMFVYSAFSFFIPCIHLLVLFLLFSVPMKLINMKRLHFITHILSSFSALEVWILATIVTVLQIQFVSYSVLDAQCSNLLPTFQTFANYGFIDVKDANCFTIDGNFHWEGMILLPLSVIFSYLSQILIMKDSQNVIKWREEGKDNNSKRIFNDIIEEHREQRHYSTSSINN